MSSLTYEKKSLKVNKTNTSQSVTFQSQLFSPKLPVSKFKKKRVNKKEKERFAGYFPDHAGLRTHHHIIV